MAINLFIYGVFAYFAGLLLCSAFSLAKNFSKKALWFFVLFNFLGFVLGITYFVGIAPNEIMLSNWSGFLHFAPTMNILSAIFFTLVSGISMLVGIYSARYLEKYDKVYNYSSTLFLMIIFVLGMQGVLFANNAFSFLFFWEVMSIASFFLVIAEKNEASMRAAFLYFIMTHLGAAAILAGFLILSGGHLMFEFSKISLATQALSPMLLVLSFLLFSFGFGSKAGLVPFHVWLPEAHPQAPSSISAMMSGLMLKIAIYGFIKVAFAYTGLPSWTAIIIIILGLLSGMVGVLYAVVEKDMKKAFAYSSVENVGIIFTMLGMGLYLFLQHGGEKMDIAASAIVIFGIFHAINHAVFKSALFLSSGVVISRVHAKSLELMGGIAKIMPVFAIAFLLSIIASMPIPPFGTFFGEWGFIQGIISLLHNPNLGGTTLLGIVFVMSILGLISGLAIFVMVKIFGISMLGLSRSHLDKEDEKNDALMVYPIMILAVVSVLLGIFAKGIMSWLMNFSQTFLFSQNAFAYESSMQLSSIVIFVAIVFFLLLTFFFLEKICQGLKATYLSNLGLWATNK